MDDEEGHKSSLRPNNPFKGMNTAEDEVRPGFLNVDKEVGAGAKRVGQKAAKAALLGAAEWAAGVPPEQPTTGGGLLDESRIGKIGGLYSGSGKNEPGAKGENGKAKKVAAGVTIAILLLIIPVMLLTVNIPLVMVGMLDMNLQNLGISQINAVLEAQAEHITKNALKEGKVPQPYAGDLAASGIEVGQINLAGEFVRTDTYIADLDSDKSIASLDDTYLQKGDNGELVVKFKDKIIEADDFVLAVESDPEMYAAYSGALNINAKFQYSDDVEKIYKGLGIEKSSAEDWVSVENFAELVTQKLDNDPTVTVNGYRGSSGEEESADGGEEQGASGENSDTLIANSAEMKLATTGGETFDSKLAVSNNSNKQNTSSNTNKQDANDNINNYTLIEGYGSLTFYGPDAASNGGYAGQNAYSAINGGALADGQVAKDDRDGGALNFGDVVYIETTPDPNAEGSYAHGKYFIVSDSGGETHGGGTWDIDIFVDEPNPRDLWPAPYGEFSGVKVYKVASGVSWDEYLSTYYGKNGGSVAGNTKRCSNGGVVETDEGFTVNVKCDAQAAVRQVGTHTKGEQSTSRGAQLLGVALSATEWIKAANAFVFTEGILQRTRIFGNNRSVNMVAASDINNGILGNFAAIGDSAQGDDSESGAPISELMDWLEIETPFTYTDVVTMEEVTVTESIMKNDNFAAGVSMGKYNMQEAQNFQRDRVLLATSSANNEIINSTTLATNGNKKSNTVLKIGSGESADMDVLSRATNSMSTAFSLDASEWFSGTVGGNRIIEGGFALPNIIGQETLGMMPSDAQTIYAYNREVDKVLARQAEAERVTKSPFDITSKNTFLGSIMYNLAASTLGNNQTSTESFSMSSLLGTVAHMVDYSGKSLLNSVVADGPQDTYLDVIGKNCATSNSVSVDGDLYCTQHNTATTKYMSYNDDQWNEVLSEDDKKRFSLLAMNSQAPVGLKDGEVCEVYKKEFRKDDDGAVGEMIHGLSDLLSKMAGLYESCSGVDDEISLRSYYTNTSANGNREKVEQLSGFALYDRTKSIIYDTKSEMTAIRDEYYAKYPQDNSPEAKLARISGLSKEEAKIAMNYASYLNVIANYNPTTRYAFGKNLVNIPQEVEFVDDGEVKSSTYLAWFGKFEYSDVRNRSFVV